MAGQGSSRKHHQHHPHIKNPVFNARVSYPINDDSSDEIRSNILKDFFGYNEADIIALNEQKPGYFYINDKNTPKDKATGAQIRSWKFNVDGTVKIDMPQTLIDDLTIFREQRASFEALRAGIFITDTETRQMFTNDIENILTLTGDKRIQALDDLMVMISGSKASHAEIYRSLRFITNESGYKDNPFLMLAVAATTSYQSDAPSFGSAAVNRSAIAAAVRVANVSLYGSSTKNFLFDGQPIGRSENKLLGEQFV